jgi:fatty-acyl-CoA synthase
MDVSRVLSDNDLKIYGRSQWAVEATKKDWFYGFKYDVSVRIDPQTIDIRSVSRQKVPDLGANCRLVTRLVKALKAQRP